MCRSDRDCQLNGKCTRGRCVCLDAWRGADCSFLDSRPSPGPAHGLKNVSSWGGRSWRWEKDGRWHGFFTEFGGQCGMNMWMNNSHVAHMVADSPAPDGGYTPAGIAIPAYSHCVDPVRLPDGRWLLFHNGDGVSRAGCAGGSPGCTHHPGGQWLADCSANGNGTTPGRPHDILPARPPPRPPAGFEASNGVHIADSPYGPWRAPDPAALVGFPACDCPAVHVLRNGSIAYWCQAIFSNYANRPFNLSSPKPITMVE
eukprot:gene139-10152_t